jgi:hypothetical protein
MFYIHIFKSKGGSKKMTKEQMEIYDKGYEFAKWAYSRGFITYVEKGTGRHQVISDEKAVILDYSTPDILEKFEEAKAIITQICIREQLQQIKAVQSS